MNIPEKYLGPIAKPEDEDFSDKIFDYMQKFTQSEHQKEKCRLPLSSFLCWSALNYDRLTEDIFLESAHYLVRLNSTILTIENQISNEDMNILPYQIIEDIRNSIKSNPTFHIKNFEPYENINFCKNRAARLL